MILLVHMLFGAVIGYQVKNPFLAVILALLGHYLIDVLPHTEYSVVNVKAKNWSKTFPEVLKIILDFCLGLLLIFLFSNPPYANGIFRRPIVYLCTGVAIIPDALTVLSLFFKNDLLEKHNKFHRETLHYFKYKKISMTWRIMTQVLVVLISLVLLKV